MENVDIDKICENFICLELFFFTHAKKIKSILSKYGFA